MVVVAELILHLFKKLPCPGFCVVCVTLSLAATSSGREVSNWLCFVALRSRRWWSQVAATGRTPSSPQRWSPCWLMMPRCRRNVSPFLWSWQNLLVVKFLMCVCKYKIGWETSEWMFSVEIKVVNEFSHVLTCNPHPHPIYCCCVCYVLPILTRSVFVQCVSGRKKGRRMAGSGAARSTRCVHSLCCFCILTVPDRISFFSPRNLSCPSWRNPSATKSCYPACYLMASPCKMSTEFGLCFPYGGFCSMCILVARGNSVFFVCVFVFWCVVFSPPQSKVCDSRREILSFYWFAVCELEYFSAGFV